MGGHYKTERLLVVHILKKNSKTILRNCQYFKMRSIMYLEIFPEDSRPANKPGGTLKLLQSKVSWTVEITFSLIKLPADVGFPYDNTSTAAMHREMTKTLTK